MSTFWCEDVCVGRGIVGLHLELYNLYWGRYIDEGNKYQYQVTSIVMTLAKKMLDEGRCLYIDNWHSCIELLDELRKWSTDVIDTVRKY